MQLIKKPKIAILSLRNSYTHGGVFSLLKVVYSFCQIHFDPTVFYLSFDKELSTSVKNLKFTASTKQTDFEGMKSVAVGAKWAFWEPGHYSFTLPMWKKLLAEYDYFWAVSGTPIVAHPLALLDKKFALLACTLYDDDRQNRVKNLHGLRRIIDSMANKNMKKIEKLVLQKASIIWPMSTYAQEKFTNTCQKTNNKMILCGYPMETSTIIGLDQKKEKNIIAVGRFSDPRKNIDMLMQSFDLVWKNQPNCKLYVIGQKPEAYLIEKYKINKSFNNIIFTGKVSDDQLNDFYKKAWLMLITSHQEGFGIVGLEAMRYGVPIITTNCGGPTDFVIEGKTGYIVEINNHIAMATKALKILNNVNLLKQLSENTHVLLKSNFSTEHVHNLFINGLAKIYPNLQIF